MPRSVQAPHICEARDVSTAPHRDAPTTDNGQPTTLPLPSASSPTTDNRQPTTLPLPSASSPTTDNRQPTTDNRQPTTPPSPTVFFPGWRSHAELPRFYAHAGAFVHPAISEPWGLVVNEAMASGLPVLVSPGTGAGASLLVADKAKVSFTPDMLESASDSLKALAHVPHEIFNTGSPSPREVAGVKAACSAFGSGLTSLVMNI